MFMRYNDLNFENYKIILNSCLFDEEWYLNEYFKYEQNTIDPIFHYLIEGVDLGFNPNPIFDTNYYLNKNLDVKNVGINPLIHYILHGKLGNRVFSPNFKLKGLSLEEELFYNNPNTSQTMLDGIKKILELNIFNEKYYLNKYPEVKKVNVNPLIHYLKIGANENKNPSPVFDTEFYKTRFPEIKKNNLNPLIHYTLFNRDPSSINEENAFFVMDNEDKFVYLNNKIKQLDDKYEQELEENEIILDSYNKFFNFIFQHTDIKPMGIHRNTQLQTLEMLKFIVKLCNKNNLTYWLDYGSLIGAVRHQGFVPWDDEADIVMPRQDFEILVEILINELNENKELNDRIKLQIAFGAYRGRKSINSFPSPCIQFVDKVPLANVDIQIIEYYDIDNTNVKQLFESPDYFKRIQREFDINLRKEVYENVNEAYINQSEKVGITFEKTEFIGSSLDFNFRTPMNKNRIFPLKKITFEGLEFNAPKDPIYYLNAAEVYHVGYMEDMMKVPRTFHNHDRTITVPKQLQGKDIDKEFSKTLSFWKYINSIY